MNASEISKLVKQAAAAQDNHEHDKAIRLYEKLFAQTDSLALTLDPDAKSLRLDALRDYGLLLHRLGQPEKALKSYEQCYLEAGTSRRAIEALALIGRQHSQMSEHNKALGAHREALELAKAFNDTLGRARAYGGIGAALRGLGRIEESVSNAEKALLLFQQVGHAEEQTRAGNHLGISYARLGKIDKAIHAFGQGLELARDVGARETAFTLNNLGECYQNLYDMEQAYIYHQEAVALNEAIQMPGGSADLYRNLGVDLYYLGQSEEGMAHLRRALKMSEREGRPGLTMQVLYSLALAEIESGDLENAQAHMQALMALAEENKTTGHIAKALHVQGLCYQHGGEHMAARQVWQQATILAQETGQQMLIWQLHAAQAAIASNEELSLIHNRIAAEIIEQIVYPIEDEKLRQKFLNAPPVQAVLTKVGS